MKKGTTNEIPSSGMVSLFDDPGSEVRSGVCEVRTVTVRKRKSDRRVTTLTSGGSSTNDRVKKELAEKKKNLK